ncbi:MAG: histidine kinase [Saprospiraceae bacterium]|nr:histidine kinase [Saprospiraceae bacterium]
MRVIGCICLLLAFHQEIALGQDALSLLRRAQQLRLSQVDSSSWYAARAYEAALEENNDSLAVDALFLKAWNTHSAGDLQGGIDEFKELLVYPGVAEDDVGYIRALGRVGVIYTDLGMFDSAMVYMLRYDQLVDQHIGTTNTEAKLHLGELYRAMGRLDKSNEYKLEAIRRARISGRRMDRIMSLFYYLDDNLSNIGSAEMQPYLEEYLTLIDVGEWDESVRRQHAPLLLGQLTDTERVNLLEAAVAQNKQRGLTWGILFLNSELARSLDRLDRDQEAIAAAKDGLKMARAHGDMGHLLGYHNLLASIYEEQSEYARALYHQGMYFRLRDSLKTISINRNLDSLNVRFETARKEAQIADQSLEIQRKTNQRNLLLAGLAMALWFGTFAALYFWNRNRLTRKLARQDAEISRQHIAQLEQEKQLLAMHSMIEGQEAERIRIARDLHDGLGGLLGTVKAHFSVIQNEIRKLESIDVYDEVDKLIDTASAEVRRISHNMAPHALRFGGLRDALHDLAVQLRTHGLAVTFEWPEGPVRLDQPTEVMIYRIVQELTNNVVKYANASHLLIQFTLVDEVLSFVVEDDGQGFDLARASTGLGLKSVGSRVTFLHGSLDIDSMKGEGTTVTVQIPLPEINPDTA